LSFYMIILDRITSKKRLCP